MPKVNLLIICILLANLNSFRLFYVDKQRAIHRKRRIAERSLLLSSLAFGGVGAFLAMNIFRHKTKHLSFKIFIPLSLMLTIFALIYIIANEFIGR